MNTSPTLWIPSDPESDAIAQQLASKGWVLVLSVVLGEPVVMKRDASVSVSLPDRYREAVVYLAEEVASLVGVGPEELRVLHEIKRVFGGRIRRDVPVPAAEVAVSDSEEAT